jgi:hypothetical protein
MSTRLFICAILATLSCHSVFAVSRVVCVSDEKLGSDDARYVTAYEGWARNQAEKDIATKSIGAAQFVVGGALADCIGKVQDGDQLLIIAHGCDGGGQFKWAPAPDQDRITYNGFDSIAGSENNIPNTWGQRKNVTATLGMCFGCLQPTKGDKRSLCKKLLDEMMAGGNNTCLSFPNVADTGIGENLALKQGVANNKASQAQIAGARNCLAVNRSWRAQAPVQRPGAATTHQTAAQALLDGACKASTGGNVEVTGIAYGTPKDRTPGVAQKDRPGAAACNQ